MRRVARALPALIGGEVSVRGLKRRDHAGVHRRDGACARLAKVGRDRRAQRGRALVDDHALVRRGFRRLLEDDPAIAVVGEASTGEEALSQAAACTPDVIVMDAAMPGLGGIAAHAISPTLYAKLPFNPREDFTFVSTIWWLPNLLAVNLDVPAKSVAELIELCRKNPGKYTFGGGVGSPSHVMGSWMNRLKGLNVTHIPYRGGAQAVSDVVGGHIDIVAATPSTILQQAQAGRLRVGGIDVFDVLGGRHGGLFPVVAVVTGVGAGKFE